MVTRSDNFKAFTIFKLSFFYCLNGKNWKETKSDGKMFHKVFDPRVRKTSAYSHSLRSCLYPASVFLTLWSRLNLTFYKQNYYSSLGEQKTDTNINKISYISCIFCRLPFVPKNLPETFIKNSLNKYIWNFHHFLGS